MGKDSSKLVAMQDGVPNHDAGRPPATNRLTEASRDQSANQQLGEANRGANRLRRRHTVKEAAEVLGTTVDAVRGRIRRGTLDSVKLDGVVYVLLDATIREQQGDKSATEADSAAQQTANQSELVADQSELVGELRGQIDWLRREVERKDTIIMQMAQRIPELESPREARESPESPSEDPANTHNTPPAPEHPVERPSWWRKFFGLE